MKLEQLVQGKKYKLLNQGTDHTEVWTFVGTRKSPHDYAVQTIGYRFKRTRVGICPHCGQFQPDRCFLNAAQTMKQLRGQA